MSARRIQVIPLLLFALLSVFALAACGGSPAATDTPDDTTTTLPVTEENVIDAAGIGFFPTTFLYDGNEKELTVTGDLPEGVSVAYANNTMTEIGTQEATAVLSKAGCENVVLHADLTVIRFPLKGVSFTGSSLTWDGLAHSLAITGELPEGYSVSYTGNGMTDVGVYRVTASFTVPADAEELPDITAILKIHPLRCVFSVERGLSTTQTGVFSAGTEITVSPSEGFEEDFLCWTVGAPLAEGGTRVSFDGSYRFTLSETTNLFGNYSTDGAPVLYHLNGGTVAATGATFYSTTFSSPFHPCYNAVADVGTFIRPGYTLLEYNTALDGTGTAVNPGGKVAIPECGILDLYAVWGKWSAAANFTYKNEENEGKVTITGYLADETMLVIPAELNGLPVVAIAEGAFTGKNFVTLSVPSSVTTIEIRAFTNCKSFDVLYLCDNISYINNDSFYNCRRFTTFCYNAAIPPRQTGTGECAHSHKFDLLMTETGNSIVVVSGSSSLNGLNSPLLEQLLAEEGYDYHVINYGTNQGTNGVLYLEVASHFLEEGDILIDAPEYNGIQYGNTKLAYKLFRSNELCCNIFRYVDMSHYTNLFGAIYEYNTTKKRLSSPASAGSYEDCPTNMNQNGDLNSNATHTNFLGDLSKVTPMKISAGTIYSEAAANFNMGFDLLAAVGVKVYFSFPPFLDISLSASSDVEAYVNALKAKLHCVVISDDPRDYLLKYELMYNSVYHPTLAGAAIRSRLLARDILAQFKIEESETTGG